MDWLPDGSPTSPAIEALRFVSLKLMPASGLAGSSIYASGEISILVSFGAGKEAEAGASAARSHARAPASHCGCCCSLPDLPDRVLALQLPWPPESLY